MQILSVEMENNVNYLKTILPKNANYLQVNNLGAIGPEWNPSLTKDFVIPRHAGPKPPELYGGNSHPNIKILVDIFIFVWSI